MRDTIIFSTLTMIIIGVFVFLITFNPHILATLFVATLFLGIYIKQTKKKKFLVRVRTYGHGGAFTIEWSYGYDTLWKTLREPKGSYEGDYFRKDAKEVIDFANRFDSYEKLKLYNDKLDEMYPKIDNQIIIEKYDE